MIAALPRTLSRPLRPLRGLACAATLALAAAPALADLAQMTDEERANFREEVRAYLMENPEVLMEAISVLDQRQAEAQSAGDADLISDLSDDIYDDGHSWVGGNPDGDVTIVEFLDYRCGYCRRAHPEVDELVEADGNIRLIVKEFPILGEQSLLGSQFAISVLQTEGDAAYKAVNDALMTMRGNITDESLRDLAEEQELDVEAVMAGMESDDVRRIITENHELAQKLRINGTPSFVFGDQMVRGYVPLDAMQDIVEEMREG
ncbi:DsbA family protein [Mesobaculum littorinae]|uniref:DsbA family protein n=1 Tax=Mesobaculum littorinae TaxID=2486419 RepID=A0A438AM60_9RHOB|nr:DsbA family protein [Mesobaculum littorinae]RVV99838.1 DsbA family protein [Mesobaculum littorinae]